MNRRHLLLSLSFLLFGLALATGTGLADTRVFVDSAGRNIALPDKIERVMAAGPPASVLLYALAPDKMAGWVREFSPQEKAFIAEPYRDLPVHGRLTGKGNTANLEAVLAMKPDVILDVGTVDATYASLADRVQQQTGIPYILIDGSFAKTAETLRTVGGLLGVNEHAEELARFSEAATERVNAVLAAVPADQRPRVYYGRGPKGLETGLAGSINMEVLGVVGATNVAEAAGSGGLANVSVEQVLSWNPDVILTLDKGFQKSLLTDRLWSGVAAVVHKRVYHAPALPFGWVDSPPGVNRLIGIDWLLAALYPERSSGELRQEASEFYKLFYHVDLSSTQIDLLLSDAASSN